MKTWRLTAAAALTLGLVAAVPASALAAPAASWQCGSDTALIQNGYGDIVSNGAAASMVSDGNGDFFCYNSNSEGDGYVNMVDTDFYSAYLTWNSRTDGVYATTVSYPASQGWYWQEVPSGSYEIVNYYSQTCLAGTTGDLYMYTCLKNGAKSLDWEPTS
jgi:hypothetical protein